MSIWRVGLSVAQNAVSPERESSTPIERILEAGIFAPLGFVLKRDEVVPELAKAGRQQLAFCQSLGKAALKSLVKKQAPAQAKPARQAPTAEIDGYDDLTAREVVTKLPTWSNDQARWVRTREIAGKNRVTILRALDARDD